MSILPVGLDFKIIEVPNDVEQGSAKLRCHIKCEAAVGCSNRMPIYEVCCQSSTEKAS